MCLVEFLNRSSIVGLWWSGFVILHDLLWCVVCGVLPPSGERGLNHCRVCRLSASASSHCDITHMYSNTTHPSPTTTTTVIIISLRHSKLLTILKLKDEVREVQWSCLFLSKFGSWNSWPWLQLSALSEVGFGPQNPEHFALKCSNSKLKVFTRNCKTTNLNPTQSCLNLLVSYRLLILLQNLLI